jgi:parallel beta-helix repeat protein
VPLRTRTLLCTAVAACVAAAPAHADVLTVGPGETIQEVVAAAEPGDTISVPAGSYAETVVVDKPLELHGGPGHASVVQGFHVVASTVTIDGFTVENSPDGPGIQLSGSGADRTITDNVIRSNVFGLYLGGEDVTVSGNSFEANNDEGAAGGNGIYSDQGARNVSITDNSFTGGHASASIAFVGSGAPAQSEIAITDNQLADDNAIFLINTEDVTISENAVSSSSTHGVQLDGGNNGVDVVGNSLTDADWSAVRVSGVYGTGSNSGVTVKGNTFTGQNDFGLKVSDGAHAGTLRMEHNRIAGDGPEALVNEDASQVDARNNWWGCNLGPATGGCTSVAGNVDATHRLQLALTASPAAIRVGGEGSALGLDLTRTSHGADFASVPLPPVPVALAANLGTIAPQQPTLTNGLGSSTLSSGSTPGDVTVSAQLDEQVVGSGVRFKALPAVEVNPGTSASDLGAHELTATVLDDGAPLSGRRVRFTVTGANPSGPQQTAQTDAAGATTIALTGTSEGEDEVSGYADLDGDGTHDAGEPGFTAEVHWFDALALSPLDGSRQTGEAHSVTATVKDPPPGSGAPAPDHKLVWSVDGANEQPLAEAPLFANDTASITWPGAEAGQDTLTVFDDQNDNGERDAGEPRERSTVTWSDPPPQAAQEQPRQEPPLEEPPLEQAGPAPDTVGPAVGLVRRNLRVSRTGSVSFSLFCPREESAGCTGSTLIETAKAVRVKRGLRKRKVPLGTRSFRLPAGQLSIVQVRLSRANRTLVRRLGRVRVNVIVVATDSAGNSTRVSLPMTLIG